MKTVKHYHLEYVLMIGERWSAHVIPFRDPGEAAAAAKVRENEPKLYACVRVTGPHQHEVPE